MNAGHFGLATGVKAWAPRLPLWALLLAGYLLDVIFIILFAAGVESFAPIDPAEPGYGAVVIDALYTHSLVGSLLIAAVAGLLAGRFWGRRGGMVIGAVVFSHWILDLLVHRPDLPILPGNAGNLPLLGLGLWELPVVSALMEVALIGGGVFLYYRRARQLPVAAEATPGSQRRRVVTASLVTLALLLLVLISDVLGL